MSVLVPAVLAQSKDELRDTLALFARMPHVSRVQIDVVDGRFAAPACWPYTALQEFREMLESGAMLPHRERFEYEIDLMCLDAERMGNAWLAMGASRLVFHAESTPDLPRLLMAMRATHGAEPGFTSPLLSFGVALNLASDLALIESALPFADFVQFMGIRHIGKQHMPFDPRVYEKIQAFRVRHPGIRIQVDGGITLDHARELLRRGVSEVIAGSTILRSKDPIAAAAAFDELESPYGI